MPRQRLSGLQHTGVSQRETGADGADGGGGRARDEGYRQPRGSPPGPGQPEAWSRGRRRRKGELWLFGGPITRSSG